MDTRLPGDVQKLLDIEEIRQLKARFGRLADALCVRQDDALAREFGELFSEDATIDSAAFGHYEGRADIQALFSRAVPSQMAGMWHGFFNPEIEIDGDRARAEWAMLAYTKPHTPKEAAPMLTIGRYRDEYVRINHRWKHSKLRLETVLTPADSLSRAAAGTREAMSPQ
jgi:hypothetical protein